MPSYKSKRIQLYIPAWVCMAGVSAETILLQLFESNGVYENMKIQNRYFRIATIGLVLNLLLQVVLFFAVDPYFASILSPLYSIWFILFVVGWREKHPRR